MERVGMERVVMEQYTVYRHPQVSHALLPTRLQLAHFASFTGQDGSTDLLKETSTREPLQGN
jgi:hypothetical protein